MAVRDRFAGWAPGYERDGLAGLLLDRQAACFARLGLAAEDRFLDVGCATGAAVRQAARRASLAVGVDPCAAMIGEARRLMGGGGFACGRAERLPFASGSFTAVLCTSALRHFTDPGAAVAEMARVLRPGGRLVVGDFLLSGPAHRFPLRVAPFSCLAGGPLAVSAAEWTLTPFGRYGTVLLTKQVHLSP